MTKAVLFLCVLAVATARADTHLTPTYTMAIPPNRRSVLSLEFAPAPNWTFDGQSHVMITTESDTWMSHNADTSFVVTFDPNIAGVRLVGPSQVTYDHASQLFFFAGGYFDLRLYAYSPVTASVISEDALTDLYGFPNGLAVRSGTNDVFVSFAGGTAATGYTPSLYRYTAGAGDQIGVAFGHTGPGTISSQVGALRIGPDGRLNVLDTGRQEILRYDPETLAYVDAISLVSATTDNASFVISSTGYVFTADLNSTSGVIYDYVSGDYVGTFAAPIHPTDTRLGRLAMTADDVGNVYVSNVMVSSQLAAYSTAAIPEPAHCSLAAGVLLAGLTFLRRRQPRP